MTARASVSEAPSHLRASGGSLVPDTLTELREAAQLKKCLNEGGTSLPFLQERPREGEEGDVGGFKNADSIMQDFR